MARTLGTLLGEARTMLSDKVAVNDTGDEPYRYSDDELMDALNGAFAEARGKRPDLFLDWGLRSPFPQFSAQTDLDIPWPLDVQYYNAFLYYVIGYNELREDTFSQDSRAVSLMNRFTSQLLTVSA